MIEPEEIMSRRIALIGLLIWFGSPPALWSQDGADLYLKHCAQCHESASGEVRAPGRDAMVKLSPVEILRSMDSGTMVSFGRARTAAERKAIAEYVAGRPLSEKSTATPDLERTPCERSVGWVESPLNGPQWNGWGVDLANSRFQAAKAAGLTLAQVPKLKLKWAFGFLGAYQAYAQPAVVGGRVFVGSATRKVYSLDAKTGCTYWTFEPEAAVRTAINIGPLSEPGKYAAYFGDMRGTVYAVDAATGALIWKTKVESHSATRITGAPALHAGRLYVPVSSFEEGSGSVRTYQCCTFRGSMVALDALTGKQIWKTYTISEEPKPTTKNAVGAQRWGPSGAAIWSAPTLDPGRNVLYVATGNNYSNPPTPTSDAILAMDMQTGAIHWSQQVTPNDAYIVACRSPDKTNCPENSGPDVDFGQSPILVTLPGGGRALVVGQKSGVMHALDPDQKGKILWQTRVGKGGVLGGIMWGSAADGKDVYVANSDVRFLAQTSTGLILNPKVGGGLFALDLVTGKIRFSVPPMDCGDRKQCSPALAAAVTAIPGVVFSGGVSGFLRAYATTDGSLLWEYDTAQEYETVNSVKANGGSMEGPGPTAVDGMIYVNSGYGSRGSLAGNVLLAFSVDGK
jgi:polyvinyl alcohol dehydrogenase (cytochrome)